MATQSSAAHTSGSMMLGMLMGAVAGLTAGVLLAPRSGRETRKQISMKAKDMSDKAKAEMAHKKDMVKSKTQDVANKAKSVVHDKAQTVSDKTT